MSDHKLAFIFFEIGMILCVVAMILGPVGIDVWSVAFSAVAIFLACAGTYLAFCSWKEPDDPKRGKQAIDQGEETAIEYAGRNVNSDGNDDFQDEISTLPEETEK